jgi:transcriptional regulator with XRE-family HTH domain
MANLSASDLAGRRIREGRLRRGWTVRELAERCAKAGAPQMTAVVIGDLETRRRASRQITVDELLTLAHILEVPPLQLTLPLGAGEKLEVVPGVQMSALEALRWIGGPAAPLNAGQIRSGLADSTARLLRLTGPGDVLTLLRQAGYILWLIASEDRLLEDNPEFPGPARLLPLLADRLMHVAARLEALGYEPPPLGAAGEILRRRGLPSTLAQWRGQAPGSDSYGGGDEG